jgi:hypothetical protein
LIEFVKLLGLRLKDPAIARIIESLDLEVTYDFDGLRDSNEDVYWIEALNRGFLLRFDRDQVLSTVYLYLVPSKGYTAIPAEEIDVTVFQTFDEAEREYKENGVPYSVSSGEPPRALRMLGITSMHKLWIKRDCGRYTVHHQFKDGHMSMITLQTNG